MPKLHDTFLIGTYVKSIAPGAPACLVVRHHTTPHDILMCRVEWWVDSVRYGHDLWQDDLDNGLWKLVETPTQGEDRWQNSK